MKREVRTTARTKRMENESRFIRGYVKEIMLDIFKKGPYSYFLRLLYTRQDRFY